MSIIADARVSTLNKAHNGGKLDEPPFLAGLIEPSRPNIEFGRRMQNGASEIYGSSVDSLGLADARTPRRPRDNDEDDCGSFND